LEKSKILTFIGFSIRARKLRAGANAVATLKKANVLIICHTASKNAYDEAIKLCKKFNAPLIESKTYKIEELVRKENCKLVAIQDESLGNAILQNLDEHFQEYSWRDNT